MIAQTKFYLGGRSRSGEPPYGTTEEIYIWERGTKTYDNGKIALMYISDYTYTYALGVDNIFYNSGGNICCSNEGSKPTSGWLYNINIDSSQWFISPFNTLSYAFNSYGSGCINYVAKVTDSLGVLPTLYLKSQIKIASGDGSIGNPYELEL